MRFISGLKKLSKQAILLIIVLLFIISWFLFLYAIFNLSNTIVFYIAVFIGFLAGFTFILLVLSIFIPIEKMGIVIIILVVVLTIPIVLIFAGIILLFFYFSFFANLIIMVFFAFKFCKDTSTGLDDFLYRKKGSRKFTRVLEFILFLILYLGLLFLIVRFFRGFSDPNVQDLADIFIFFLWIYLILIAFVLLRLIFTKKFAAYITFFYVLTFLYVLYIVIDTWADIIFFNSTTYTIFSFFIDLLLFIYIIGSILGRLDYIKEKIKILRADTIALFVILMKLLVQITKILQPTLTPTDLVALLIFQVQVQFWFFVIFTLLIGLYTIFAHKEGKRS